MAETRKTLPDHDTFRTGQQLLAALTQNEIAHLLEVLIGVLSPDMLENVFEQLQPDTRHAVQTILVPPDPSNSIQETQAPSVSLAKLEQTWSALWEAWDDIVNEAARENGNYIVQERHWEEPYFDIIALLVLTIPIIYPLILALGFDPIWFGVVVVILIEMGLITPPVGLGVYCLSSVTDIPIPRIFKGALPFAVLMLIAVAILVIFPEIALLIPGRMK